MKTFLVRSVCCLILTSAFLLTSAAQQSSPPDAPASHTVQPEDKPKDSGIEKKPGSTGTSNDRLFYTLPNFLTLENTGQVPPLTVGQKFKVVTRGSFDYVLIPWYSFLAGISQAENSEPGYGQGAQGYGKRLGASFADGTIENYMTGAVLPSLLGEDPRFFQLSQGTFWHRTGYAISRIFVTRTDSGGQQFNYSEIVGSAMSAGISTYSYHPRADRTLSNTASVWGSEVGYDTITIVVKEFWPDIRRMLSKKKDRPIAEADPR
ncbi:MAG TPA: hypothetical protein VNZ03_26315 [Terriglobales bacterium]|nr:hypothetical protein [Terriglobales bacterium]